jgi:tetratricopeptide (TPR) repeat protein
VPDHDDPLAVRPQAAAREGQGGALVPEEGVAQLSRLERPAPPVVRTRGRRAWLWAAIAMGVVATGLAGYKVYTVRLRDRPRAAQSAPHKAGYPKIGHLERRYAQDPGNERAARRLASAYERVIDHAGLNGRRGIAKIYNNAAWLYLTTEVDTVRDLERGLRYAEIAVKATNGKDGVTLDTLAEGLYRNGQVEEAVRVAEKAVALRPDLAELKSHLERYRKAAVAGEGVAAP